MNEGIPTKVPYRPYTPVCNWEGLATCFSWGYPSNPFFEVYIDEKAHSGSVYMRVERDTIEASEKAAYAKVQDEKTCVHLWGREKYRNSATFCRHCRAFRTDILNPVTVLGKWNKPLTRSQVMMLEMHEEMPLPNPTEKDK